MELQWRIITIRKLPKIVKDIRTVSPNIDGSVLAEAFIVEAINLLQRQEFKNSSLLKKEFTTVHKMDAIKQ